MSSSSFISCLFQLFMKAVRAPTHCLIQSTNHSFSFVLPSFFSHLFIFSVHSFIHSLIQSLIHSFHFTYFISCSVNFNYFYFIFISVHYIFILFQFVSCHVYFICFHCLFQFTSFNVHCSFQFVLLHSCVPSFLPSFIHSFIYSFILSFCFSFFLSFFFSFFLSFFLSIWFSFFPFNHGYFIHSCFVLLLGVFYGCILPCCIFRLIMLIVFMYFLFHTLIHTHMFHVTHLFLCFFMLLSFAFLYMNLFIYTSYPDCLFFSLLYVLTTDAGDWICGRLTSFQNWNTS